MFGYNSVKRLLVQFNSFKFAIKSENEIQFYLHDSAMVLIINEEHHMVHP